jgi:hypothetical protein
MTNEQKTINWTREMLDRFKKARQEFMDSCRSAGSPSTFTFDGNEFDEGYAKHLIEYLEGRFGDG